MPPKAADKKDVIQASGGKVKNTFLEFGEDDEAGYWKRRTRSLDDDPKAKVKHSPLVVASKSPVTSPTLQPVSEAMQAVPIDEVHFEMLEEAAIGFDEPSASASRPAGAEGGATHVAQSTGGTGRDQPAYVVPTTPSPFLHSAFPPSSVPPFGSAMGYEMGLPPAFEQDGEMGMDGFAVQPVDMEGMEGMEGMTFQGMQFMPEMYDPSYGQYMGYAWGAMPMEGDGCGGGMLEDPSVLGLQGAQSLGDADGGKLGGGGAADQAAGGDSAVDRAGAKEARRSKGRRDAREEDRIERRGGGAVDRGGAGGEAAAPPEKAPQAKPGPRNHGQEGEEYTTVMLRNIPNKYTREMLIKQLTASFGGEFDFMYLPIDFKNKCNVGYSFINFRNQAACERFVSQFNGVDVRKCLPGLNSKKVVEVTPARVQGLQENVRRLRNSPVMNQLQDHPEWMPLIFNEDGEEVPFPNPDQPLPPVKPRGRNRDAQASTDAGE